MEKSSGQEINVVMSLYPKFIVHQLVAVVLGDSGGQHFKQVYSINQSNLRPSPITLQLLATKYTKEYKNLIGRNPHKTIGCTCSPVQVV